MDRRSMDRRRDFDEGLYQIRVRDHLDASRRSSFEGMSFAAEEIAGSPPTTLLTGFVRDQAALHGILERIRDLNLELLMVRRVERTP